MPFTVAYDTVAIDSKEGTGASFNVTVGDHPNRIAIVHIGQESFGDKLSTITVGGVVCTVLRNTVLSNTCLWMGYVVNPAGGAVAVVPAFSESVSYAIACRIYYNARRTNPCTDVQGTEQVNPSYSETITSIANGMIIDAASAHSEAAFGGRQSGQNSRYDLLSPGAGGSRIRIAGTDKLGTGASLSMTGSDLNDDEVLSMAFNLHSAKITGNQVIFII